MDYATEFVNQFVTKLALNERGLRHMAAFYIWHDRREGSLTDRFKADAAKFWEVHKQLYPPRVDQ